MITFDMYMEKVKSKITVLLLGFNIGIFLYERIAGAIFVGFGLKLALYE